MSSGAKSCYFEGKCDDDAEYRCDQCGVLGCSSHMNLCITCDQDICCNTECVVLHSGHTFKVRFPYMGFDL